MATGWGVLEKGFRQEVFSHGADVAGDGFVSITGFSPGVEILVSGGGFGF